VSRRILEAIEDALGDHAMDGAVAAQPRNAWSAEWGPTLARLHNLLLDVAREIDVRLANVP